MMLVLLIWVPFLYMQIYLLNACSWSEKKTFLISMENQQLAESKYSHLFNSNMRIGTYFDQTIAVM